MTGTQAIGNHRENRNDRIDRIGGGRWKRRVGYCQCVVNKLQERSVCVCACVNACNGLYKICLSDVRLHYSLLLG